MYLFAHPVSQRLIHHLVALHPTPALECGTDYHRLKVSTVITFYTKKFSSQTLCYVVLYAFRGNHNYVL